MILSENKTEKEIFVCVRRQLNCERQQRGQSNTYEFTSEAQLVHKTESGLNSIVHVKQEHFAALQPTYSSTSVQEDFFLPKRTYNMPPADPPRTTNEEQLT